MKYLKLFFLIILIIAILRAVPTIFEGGTSASIFGGLIGASIFVYIAYALLKSVQKDFKL